jgi:hypothetical protein
MQNFCEITIHDKKLFDGYLKKYNPEASELTFTNLFMWRNYYKFRFAEKYGFLCIISEMNDEPPFAFAPVGKYDRSDFRRVVQYLRECFLEAGWEFKFKRITQNELKLFKDAFGDRTESFSELDNSDYIYSTGDLINLQGKKYDGKRNHINKFRREYEFEYVAINENNIGECFKIMDAWCAERKCIDHRGRYCERLVNTELLSNYAEVECKGALIKVNGKFEAFTVGEMLNEDTAVIHIEKANFNVNGLYTLINQQFCKNEWANTKYINREQDLGIEGIRKAKLSYHPVKMVEKYAVKVE